MKIIFNYNYNKRNDADVLARVYENQNEKYPEEEQCVGEVLFKPHLEIEHQRFTSLLPKGCSNAITKILKKYEQMDITVGIANEFGTSLGVLTSVSENFDKNLIKDLREQELKYILA